MTEVWVRAQAVAGSTVDGLLPLLDEAERARAARRRDPAAYITAHALLRTVIADHVGAAPRELAFARECATCGTTRHGKPRVVGHPGVEVSLSYSEGLAIAALTVGRPIGIDVEAVTSADFDGFASVTLHADERDGFRDLRGPALLAARARVWARKEAILKATGHGLVVDPSEVVVSAPGESARFVHWYADRLAPGEVTMVDLAQPDAEHHAALAVLGPGAVTVRPA